MGKVRRRRWPPGARTSAHDDVELLEDLAEQAREMADMVDARLTADGL